MPVIGTVSIAPEDMTIGTYDDDRLERVLWGKGPWDAEPFDWGTWTDGKTGYLCSIKRNLSGTWCGYVLIPLAHPVHAPSGDSEYGRDLTSGNPVWLDVHGGVTFHNVWSLPEADMQGVAVGFDCNHSSDISPRYANEYEWSGTYRDFPYVIEEVRSLAKQISEYRPLQQLISGTEMEAT